MSKNTYASGLFLKINNLLWKSSFLQKLRIIFYFIDSVLLLFEGKPKKANGEKKNVLVVYNLALGDAVMFLDPLRALRKLYQNNQYELTIACQKTFCEFFEKQGITDHVLPMDFSASTVSLKARFRLFKKLRRLRYDLVLDPIGCENCTTNIFVTHAAVGAEKIGIVDISMKNRQCPEWLARKIYDRLITVNQENIHLIRYYGEFVKALGNRDYIAKPAGLIKTKLDIILPKRYFIIFPTSSMPVKRWDLGRFAELAKRIYSELNIPLLVCGTNHDRQTVDEFKAFLSGVEIVDIIGQTKIMDFIEVIRNADLVVTNDTSAYHIAVAASTPVAMICGGYTFHRYANYTYKSHGVKDPYLIRHLMPCYDCNNKCIYKDYEKYPCIEQISPENAWETVQNMIKESGLLKNET